MRDDEKRIRGYAKQLGYEPFYGEKERTLVILKGDDKVSCQYDANGCVVANRAMLLTNKSGKSIYSAVRTGRRTFGGVISGTKRMEILVPEQKLYEQIFHFEETKRFKPGTYRLVPVPKSNRSPRLRDEKRPVRQGRVPVQRRKTEVARRIARRLPSRFRSGALMPLKKAA